MECHLALLTLQEYYIVQIVCVGDTHKLWITTTQYPHLEVLASTAEDTDNLIWLKIILVFTPESRKSIEDIRVYKKVHLEEVDLNSGAFKKHGKAGGAESYLIWRHAKKEEKEHFRSQVRQLVCRNNRWGYSKADSSKTKSNKSLDHKRFIPAVWHYEWVGPTTSPRRRWIRFKTYEHA